jgi:Na+/glutamate symporter
MDIVATAGRIVGVIIGIFLFGWVIHKIDQKIRGKDDKSKPPTPPATHDHTN